MERVEDTDRGERLRKIIESQRDIAAADLDLGAVMTLICERTQELTTADGGSILMLEGDELVHRAATGFMSGHTGERLGLMDTFSGSVYRSNQSAICNDTSTLPNPLASQRGIASLIAVPLRHHGGAVGLLTVLSRTPNAFDDEDLSTLELLAVVLSAAISHAFEFEALTRFHTMFVGASVGIVRFDASGRAVEGSSSPSSSACANAGDAENIDRSATPNAAITPRFIIGNRPSFQESCGVL